MQLTQRESRLLDKNVRIQVQSTGEMPRSEPIVLEDVHYEDFMTRAAKTKWGRQVYLFEGLGYWVAPVGVAVYQSIPGQYTVSMSLNGKTVRKNMSYPEEQLDDFVKLLTDAVIRVADSNGGLFTLFPMKGIMPITVTGIKGVGYVVNTPKIFRDMDPSLPKTNQRYFHSTPEKQEAKAEELREIRRKMNDRFLPKLVTSLEKIMVFHDEFPWDYTGVD